MCVGGGGEANSERGAEGWGTRLWWGPKES